METLRFVMATTFYPPYHLGGDAVHVQYLAEALAARGHEVHVEFSPAAFRLKRGGARSAARGASAVRIHPIPSAFGRSQPLAAYLLGRSRGVSRFHERLSREIRPDVVHLHNISLLGLGLVRPRPRATTVYTAHDYWVRCPRNDLLKYGTRPCEAPACFSCCLASRKPPQLWRYAGGWRGLGGLDFAIAPSRFMARAVAPHLACPVLHIPNFAPDPNPGGLVSDPEDYFLCVGALEPHKGVHLLAEAAARLAHTRVKFAGRGSLARRLEALRDRGTPGIELEGWMSQARLGPLYARAKALVMPSTCQENAPLAAIEALAWGTPLLVSRRGGLGELLHYGAAGRSFEPTSVELSEAIRRFEDGQLSRRLRRSARASYERDHLPAAYLDRYLGAVQNPPEAVRAFAEDPAAIGLLSPSSMETAPQAGLP